MSEVKDPNPKDVAGSARIDFALMDPVAVGEMCLAMEEGGTKYGYFNYTVAPVKARVYIGAAFRHLFKWLMGEERDEKTGVHHLGYTMACCMIILSAQSRGTLIDNRPPSLKGVSSRIDGFEARVKRVREVFAGHSPKHYTIEDTQNGPGEQIHTQGAQTPAKENLQREDAQRVPGRDSGRVVQRGEGLLDRIQVVGEALGPVDPGSKPLADEMDFGPDERGPTSVRRSWLPDWSGLDSRSAYRG